MNYAYVLENTTKEDKRDNSPLFNLINDLDLDEEQLCFDIDSKRVGLIPFLNKLSSGDKLLVRSVEDLSDTIENLIEIFKSLSKKDVILYSCKEPFLCGEEYAENLESSMKLILYFTKKKKEMGYQIAVLEGKVGRPAKTEEILKAVAMYKSGNFKVSQIEVITGISKSSLYRYLQENKGSDWYAFKN